MLLKIIKLLKFIFFEISSLDFSLKPYLLTAAVIAEPNAVGVALQLQADGSGVQVVALCAHEFRKERYGVSGLL